MSQFIYYCLMYFAIFVVLAVCLWKRLSRPKPGDVQCQNPIYRKWTTEEKIEAVDELLRRLDENVAVAMRTKRGHEALRHAQVVAETTFYQWLNDHYPMFHHLLYQDGPGVKITGMKNGSMAYSIPQDLQQYTKRK